MSGTTTTTLKLYVNGVLMVTTTDSTSPFTAAGKAGIMDGEAADAAQTDTDGHPRRQLPGHPVDVPPGRRQQGHQHR